MHAPPVQVTGNERAQERGLMFSGIALLRLRGRGPRRRSPNIAPDRSADQFGS
jgi:hypothetical protein